MGYSRLFMVKMAKFDLNVLFRLKLTKLGKT